MEKTMFKIAELRKAKGVTQEELANAVGVTAQAVSRWENGGAPDLELLPAISDFFEVSIDCLFGRDAGRYSSVHDAIRKYIAGKERRFDAAMDLCWTIQISLPDWADPSDSMGENPMLDYTANASKSIGSYKSRVYSQMQIEGGITSLLVPDSLPASYFMLMPKPENGYRSALLELERYRELFADLGDPDNFKALTYFNSRENKRFTAKLFTEDLQFSEEQAQKVLDFLKKYSMIREEEIELDGGVLLTYTFYTNPALFMVLALSTELIERPNNFFYYVNASNEQPLLG
ncbi:MAG: helix-turn-helix transcriptional regulator [Oscillospiraceae bacterium]|jgi:transcriptional regulator with XRE-family HTH domain|nr:helix-turn-helix transcriptional regulator [Oscillospiraceae bacterium]